jgi:hypothetical protein
MPAQAKVDGPSIRAALAVMEGVVAKAARHLEISSAALYKRMAQMGIHPDEYRKVDEHRGADHQGDTHRQGDTNQTGDAIDQLPANGHGAEPQRTRRQRAHGGDEFSGASSFNFHRDRAAHILSAVAPTATADVDEERARRQLRESRSWFLPPDQIDEIRQAKYDLQARWRIELSDSKVVEIFIRKKFKEWVTEELAAAAPAPSVLRREIAAEESPTPATSAATRRSKKGSRSKGEADR